MWISNKNYLQHRVTQMAGITLKFDNLGTN